MIREGVNDEEGCGFDEPQTASVAMDWSPTTATEMGPLQRAHRKRSSHTLSEEACVASVAPMPSVVTRGAAPSSISSSSSGSVARVMLAKTTAARTVRTQQSAQRRGRRRRRRGDRGVSASSTSTLGDTVWRWESIGAAPRVDGVQMAALLVLHQIWSTVRTRLG